MLAVALLASVFAVGAFAADEDENKKKEDETIDMPEVLVSGNKQDGSAEAGYLLETVKSLGPWGEMSAQDTPYTMMSVSSDLLENTANNSIERMIKVLPGAYDTGGYGRGKHDLGVQRIFSRGFITNYTVDGLKVSDFSIGSLYDFERVEMMSGFDSFFKGMSDEMGGTVNFVSKRPTDHYVNKVTLGNYGGTQFYVNGDFGGPVKGGRFGYRVNAQISQGEEAIKGLETKYRGISGAWDWHATDTLLVQFDASWKLDRAMGDNAALPRTLDKNHQDARPPDNHRAYGQDWTWHQTNTKTYGMGAKWTPTDYLSVHGQYKWHRFDPSYLTGGANDMNQWMLGADYDPNYRSFAIFVGDYGRRRTHGGNVYADLKFDHSGIIKHKVTVGFSIDRGKSYARPFESQQWYLPDDSNYDNYIPVDQISIPRPDDAINANLARVPRIFTKSGDNYGTNLVIGDEIGIGEHWTALIGYNHATSYSRGYKRIEVPNPNRPGTTMPQYTDEVDSEYERSMWNPTFSLLYKPVKNVTLYGTHIQQLTGRLDRVPELYEFWEQDAAGNWNFQQWPYTNPGFRPPPAKSFSYEGGVKWTANDSLLVTAALYYLDRINDFTFIDKVAHAASWLEDGREIHKGIDTTFTGKLTDRLTLTGGWTWIDAHIKKTAEESKQHEGMTPSNVPKFVGKISAEYATPWRKGFFLTGGAYYTGKQHASIEPTDDWTLGGYTVLDLGARYEAKISGFDAVFNLYLQNVTDNRYYTGTGGGVGAPRTWTFSLSTPF
jgi:iron complex outermembrane receptor protein